jgi:glutathione synthase/RimK-type ligase-like ATP-grasp enzyme
MKTVLVVDRLRDWQFSVKGIDVISSEDYLTQSVYQACRGYRVFNLCGSYTYQESGYYVSLLAAAREQKVIPSVATILDMKSHAMLKLRSQEVDELIQKSLKDVEGDTFDLSIYFGKNLDQRYDRLTKELHRAFQAPLILAKFIKKEKWRLKSIAPLGLKDVPDTHKEILERFAEDFFTKRQQAQKTPKARFDLAILMDTSEKFPPSNERAIKKFMAAAVKLGIAPEIISRDDYHRIGEFDGLFIRTTTAVNHYTYRFAQTAQELGLVVIDDPESILKCSNKVYLAEMFTLHKIPSPKTVLVHRENWKSSLSRIGLPAVLKKPDGSFSRGVVKVENVEDLKNNLIALLADSTLVVAQEFLPTAFDWRVGLLNGECLYACKYHMAKNHWQIYKQHKSGNISDGGSADTYGLDQVPQGLVKLAERAGALIGHGLYGLDIKEKDGQFYVIEINDNPNIDAGGEDKILKDGLYERIMGYFLTRMEGRANGSER